MAITAKLRVQSVDPSTNQEGVTTQEAVTLAAVTDPENADLVTSDVAKLFLVVSNPAAFGGLVEGADYHLTLEPVQVQAAPEPAPAPDAPPAESENPAAG